MGNANPNDNWQVHFRDTMRGGKFLNKQCCGALSRLDSTVQGRNLRVQ